MNLPPWSVSSMQTFFQCPRKWAARYIAKTYQEPKQDHQDWGIYVHKCLENRFKDETELPPELEKLNPLVDTLWAFPARMRMTEFKLGLDAELKPAEFFGKNVWWRGVADLILVGKDNAIVLDWKTGNRKLDYFQTNLLSAALFARIPTLKKIKQMYVWTKALDAVKTRKTPERLHDAQDITPEQIPLVWQKTLPKVRLMQQACESGLFHEKPGPLCGWCWLSACAHCPNK
jgi:hypothetical protein